MSGREAASRRLAGVPRAYFDTALDAATEAILVVSARGECLDANQAATSLLGYSREELLTLRITDLLAQGPDQQAGLAGFLTTGAWTGVVDIREKGDTVLQIEAHSRRVRPGMHLAMLRDLAAPQEPSTSQEDVLKMVSHELNTPLTVLLGRAQLMRRRGAATEADIQAIIDQAAQLSHLLKDLHLATTIEAGQLQLHPVEMDLADLARTIATRLQSTTPTHTLCVYGPESLTGYWDKEAMQQVIASLLANAIKYSPAGSRVTVRMEEQGADAQVSVEDQGMGIAPEVLPLIFDRFFRTRETVTGPHGLGLGLYISKVLVESQDGRIWIDSELEKGTIVSFRLPRAARPPEEEPKAEGCAPDTPA